MPVIGHTFVGLAASMIARPKTRTAGLGVWWTPVLVALAYLPDIVSQGGALAGIPTLRVVTHSLFFAFFISVPLSLLLARAAGITWIRSYAICAGSIVVHDVLDWLQATDKQLLWPFSDWAGFGYEGWIPADATSEALLFGLLFCVFAGWWFVKRRGSMKPDTTGGLSKTNLCPLWASRAVVALIVVAAVGTHYLRRVRENDEALVRAYLSQQQFTKALSTIERASRWPSTAKPSWLNYAAGEAHLGLGDRGAAESFYLKSIEVDPNYFWSVGDLAVLYATSDEPLDIRRGRAAPYLAELRSKFADHKDFGRVVEKIEGGLKGVK